MSQVPYRQQGQVDRGEPFGFPEVKPLERAGAGMTTLSLLADPDVEAMATDSQRRAQLVAAGRAVALLVAAVIAAVLVVVLGGGG